MRCRILALICLTVATIGCDAPPPSHQMPPTANVSADVVTDQGRGTYDWRLGQRDYILRPEEPDEKW